MPFSWRGEADRLTEGQKGALFTDSKDPGQQSHGAHATNTVVSMGSVEREREHIHYHTREHFLYCYNASIQNHNHPSFMIFWYTVAANVK
jgi:hypothetical protein